MSAVLRAISVVSRLRILIAIALIGIAAIASFSLTTIDDSLYESRRDSLRYLVETAYSVIEEHAALVKKGELTEGQAKQLAMDRVRDLRYDKNNYFWISDFQPTMLMHPFKPEMESSNVAGFKDPNGVRLFVDIAKVASNQGEGYVAYEWPRPGASKPSPKLSFVKTYQPWGWIVGTGVYVDDIRSIFWDLFKGLLVTFLIVATAMIIAGLVIGRSITSPLVHMAGLMRHVQESGDIGSKVNSDQKGELGDIASAFDGMLDGLRQFVQNIHASSHDLSTAAQQLAIVAEQTNESIGEQRMQTAQVATAMTEMSATVTEIAGSTNETAQATQGVDMASDEGEAVVNANLHAIDALAADIRNTNEVVQNLAANTDSVGTVLDVIGGIAEQTNLLALNAAIEAARAGEQGRGFAVVADEVRTLAQRTQDSTQEIQSIINSVQAAAREVVSAMENGMQQADNSVQHAQQAKIKLSDINQLVNHIMEMTTQIATAAEQQSVVAEDVSQNVNLIDGVSEKNAQGAQQIAMASQTLLGMASRLQEHAMRYRYN